jgi:hypothetical protein
MCLNKLHDEMKFMYLISQTKDHNLVKNKDICKLQALVIANVKHKNLFEILITNSHKLIHKFTKIAHINGKSGDVT